MNKILKGLFVIAVIVIVSIILYGKFYTSYSYKIEEKGVYSEIKFKGLNDAKDFAEDEYGNIYIAFSNRVQKVDKLGKSYNLIKNKGLNICSLEYYEDKLYFCSGNCIYSLDLKNNKEKKLISDIPNFGDYKTVLIKIYKSYLYAEIGSATNSGVVGEDNTWLNTYPFGHDLTPKAITLRGENFGDNKTTGAFSPYNTKNIYGQIILEHFPGNASVIIYNLKTGMAETYAYGIRNINGMDFNSDGNLIADVGGMENRGLRPIKGDCDYIYLIEKNKWYGWPDYSGGVAVDSPRFVGIYNKRVAFIIDNHPTTSPQAPIYKNKQLASLGTLAVDSKGALIEKDNIYFYDSDKHSICYLNKNNKSIKMVQFSTRATISSMKFAYNKLLVLNSKEGYLAIFSVNNEAPNISGNPKVLYWFLASIIMAIILIVVMSKVSEKNKKD